MSRRKRMPYPRPLADFLGPGIIGKDLAERLRESEIWRIWPEAVGSSLVTRARPVRIINGTLTVAVSSAPWMQQLTFLKNVLKEKLNNLLGGEIVKEIVLKSGRVAPEEEPEETARPVQPLTPTRKKFIAEQTADIADPGIREALAALMKASMEREGT